MRRASAQVRRWRNWRWACSSAVLVGGAGGFVVNVARRRGWAEGGFAGSAVLALAICAYACSLAVHGNGFIAAFVGGLGYGATSGKRGERLVACQH